MTLTIQSSLFQTVESELLIEENKEEIVTLTVRIIELGNHSDIYVYFIVLFVLTEVIFFFLLDTLSF